MPMPDPDRETSARNKDIRMMEDAVGIVIVHCS